MSTIDINAMRRYLSSSISSLNQNKLNGLKAEIEFRNYIAGLGLGDRVSVGGWIARTVGGGNFARRNVVFFPETVVPGQDYAVGRQFNQPPIGLHTICATFHQIGIQSYFLTPSVAVANDPLSISWSAVQLGVPVAQPWLQFPQGIGGFTARSRRYNFLSNHTDTSLLISPSIEEEFSKEHARISFQNAYMSELSDVDGIFWGNQFTYPIEIKEKTVAHDPKVGDFFGLDLGPFVKLAFYAAKRGNLHSLFVVREIDDPKTRNLVNWWYVKFDDLAQYASWNKAGGGKSMVGGNSTTVKIPKAVFLPLDANTLSAL